MKKFAALVIAILLGMFLFYQFWFLRIPDRAIPNDQSVFVSPANGKIKAIRTWDRDSILILKEHDGALIAFTGDIGQKGTLVSISMNLLNVHYQRNAIDGKLVSAIHKDGSYKNALIQSNEYGIRFENEHNIMQFESVNGTPYKVIQVAGFLARRIVQFPEENETLKQGDLIGLIKLGSQVSLIFPESVEVIAKVGDIVTDGETIIAKE